uniref:Laminin N-terminal domain-containing protein n=1 Tax=Oreochromis aureus TaxID=47969 RepID=A0AAZ1XV87_OREAU
SCCIVAWIHQLLLDNSFFIIYVRGFFLPTLFTNDIFDVSTAGSNQFIGRMQDFRFYPTTLTNREIVELYSGVLPELHVQSECRCPSTHPRVHPLIERYCIPNAVEDTTNDRVLRLNLNAHPLSYINDQDMGTTWVSKIMTAQELDEGVTITVDLANGQYQVMGREGEREEDC